MKWRFKTFIFPCFLLGVSCVNIQDSFSKESPSICVEVFRFLASSEESVSKDKALSAYVELLSAVDAPLLLRLAEGDGFLLPRTGDLFLYNVSEALMLLREKVPKSSQVEFRMALRRIILERKQVGGIEQKVSVAMTPIPVGEVYFTEDIGQLHQLDDTYFHNTNKNQGKVNEISGGGVSWSGDETYVVFRPWERQSQIYNTKKKKFLDYHPATGLISKTGHLYAENPADQTTIIDLDSKKKWGPFNGNPMPDFFNKKFVITRYDIPDVGTLKDQWHTLIDFRSGREIVLGKEFAISNDQTLIARIKGKTKIEVVEIKTGQVVKTFKVDPRPDEQLPNQLSWSLSGFFCYQKNAVRFSDLADFELPDDAEPKRISGDGTKLIFKKRVPIVSKSKRKRGTQYAESIVIYDTLTAQSTVFNNFDEIRLTQNEMHLLITRFQAKETLVVDLSTMAVKTIPGHFDQFSPNGRWVYLYGAEKHSIFNLETDEHISYNAGFYFSFVGQTDYILTETAGSPQNTYINDLSLSQWDGNPFALKIGDMAAKPSPSGRFILTYKDKKLRLIEFQAP